MEDAHNHLGCVRSKLQFSVLILFLFLSAPLFACWQTESAPLKLNNRTVKARFTFDGKPLHEAVVTLWSNKKAVVGKNKLNENGWVFFPAVDPGQYTLILDGPSHESFGIVLSPSFPLRTAVTVDFYGDYCHRSSVIPDQP